MSAGVLGMPASVAQATASGFGPPTAWSPIHIPGGSGGFVAADIDFDHDADVVGCAGADGVLVMQSLGTAFRDPARWSSLNWCGLGPVLAVERPPSDRSIISPRQDSVWEIQAHFSSPGYPGWFGPQGTRLYNGVFTSPLGTFAGDVNADGTTDLIAIHDTEYRVLIGRTVSAWGARPPTVGGSLATLAGDLDADGYTDLVSVNPDGVWAVLGAPGQFLAPAQWHTEAFQGSRTTMAGDVDGDGDGDTDLIAVDDDGVRVLRSTGAAFGAPEQWSTQPSFGERATLAGDVDADGDTDLIAVDSDGARVMLAG